MPIKVLLNIEGVAISGRLYLPEAKGPHPVVCLCHGIPAQKPEPGAGDYGQTAEEICRAGFAAMIFNFRGTGASGGNLDMLGWSRDLTAVIDYLFGLPDIDRSRLSLLGFSGGAAVAIYVAAGDRRVSCLAAAACPADFTRLTETNEPHSVVDHFRSIGAIRDASFPASPRQWLAGFRTVRPIDYVANIAPRPLLLVHGNSDQTVEVNHAHRLYHRSGEPRELVIIDGAGHRLRHDNRAMAAIIGWLKAIC
ncbi:MAG: alpha/beta fold hydrolase [Dehalococcoidales bacterium]